MKLSDNHLRYQKPRTAEPVYLSICTRYCVHLVPAPYLNTSPQAKMSLTASVKISEAWTIARPCQHRERNASDRVCFSPRFVTCYHVEPHQGAVGGPEPTRPRISWSLLGRPITSRTRRKGDRLCHLKWLNYSGGKKSRSDRDSNSRHWAHNLSDYYIILWSLRTPRTLLWRHHATA